MGCNFRENVKLFCFLKVIIILFLFFVHLFFGLLIENVKSRTTAFFLNLSLFVVIIYFTVGITYTADWFMYSWIYDKGDDNTDIVFFELSKIFNSLNLEYESLYIFHMLGSLIIYWFLISRYTRNYFYVFLLYILLDYVHFTNQIRYYLGLPILFTGFYYLVYKKKYIFSIFMIILSMLCHAGLATLVLFIPVYFFVPIRKFIKLSLVSSLVVALIVFLLMKGGLALVLDHYDAYFSSEYDSSLIGGIFNGLPYMVYYVFILIETPKLIKKKNIVDHPMYELLFKLAFFSLLFLPASFFLQIIGHRYIMPFAIFWIIFYLYLIQDLPQKQKLFKMVFFGIIHFTAIFCIYILPDFVLPQNHFMEQVELTIQSIPYLKDLFF